MSNSVEIGKRVSWIVRSIVNPLYMRADLVADGFNLCANDPNIRPYRPGGHCARLKMRCDFAQIIRITGFYLV